MDGNSIDVNKLNLQARQVFQWINERYPHWSAYAEKRGRDDISIVVPAPGRLSESLSILTDQGNYWVRFAPQYAWYGVNDKDELLTVVDELVNDRLFIVVIMKGHEFIEVNLASPGSLPNLEPEETAQIISWSGTHDEVLKGSLK